MSKLLYIDASYTEESIREKGLLHVLDSRLLEGYFTKVWSAHPLNVNVHDTESRSSYGPPTFNALVANHIFVGGRLGRFWLLRYFRRFNGFLSLCSFIFTLMLLARREKIKIIRAGDPLLCGLIGVFIAKFLGAQLAIRICADNDMIRKSTGRPMLERFGLSHHLEHLLEKFVMKQAKIIFVPSDAYKVFALRKGAQEDQIVKVPYSAFVDPIHLTVPSERTRTTDKRLAEILAHRPLLGCIGRLSAMKKVTDTVEVLRQVRSFGIDARLCLVGDGPQRSELVEQARTVGIEQSLILLGNVDQKTLASIIPCFDVILSPLTGRALLEVAIGGAAVVAYDLDWQGELIHNGRNGFLVPAGDTEKMARAAQRLLVDRAFANKLADNLRKDVLEQFESKLALVRERSGYDLLQKAA